MVRNIYVKFEFNQFINKEVRVMKITSEENSNAKER
jgi:hypothetical protein